MTTRWSTPDVSVTWNLTPGADQMASLSTNNRYLHDNILQLAETLVDTCQPLNPQLTSCLFVNSGSEANDLALRMSRTHSGNCTVSVLSRGSWGEGEEILYRFRSHRFIVIIHSSLTTVYGYRWSFLASSSANVILTH